MGMFVWKQALQIVAVAVSIDIPHFYDLSGKEMSV